MPWPSMARIRAAFVDVFSKPEEKYASAARSQKRTPVTGHGGGGMSPRPAPMSFTAVSQADTERAFLIRSNTWGASFSRRRARSSLAEDQDRPIFPERILSSGPASRNLAWLRTFVRRNASDGFFLKASTYRPRLPFRSTLPISLQPGLARVWSGQYSEPDLFRRKQN